MIANKPSESMSLREIITDLDIIRIKIGRLRDHEEENTTVKIGSYLSPVCNRETVPLDHPKGKLQYYLFLLGTLEHVESNETLPKDMLPERAPQYLKDLVRN